MPQPQDADLTISPVTAAAPKSGPPISPRLVPGAIVAGRYRLVALLGRGGMGEVYRADDLTLDHPVALKFLPEGVAHDGARLAQFHNELRIARQVSHKNVCRLYDLSGQMRDARVGRDVLIGVSAGILVLLLSFSVPLVASLVGRPLPPRGANLRYLLGARFALAAQLRAIPNALQNAMFVALVFVVGRAISGRRWVGAAMAVVLFGVLVLGEFGDSLLIGILFALLFTGALVATLVYFGLLAHVVAFFVNLVIVGGVLTADMSKMYAPTSAELMLVITGLAAFGFYASRAGQPMFGNLLPRD